MAGTRPSGGSGDYKNFKQTTRDRLLHELLRSCKTGSSKLTHKVLIMDELTMKIMSGVCKFNDTYNEGVSLLERIERPRLPLRWRDAIYFIQPSKENVIKLLSDMSGGAPLYRKAFVFFSLPISKELRSLIEKADEAVLARISALREMNLEYVAVDCQGFVTSSENGRDLEQLCGSDEEDSSVACLKEMAARVATVFASLREFPIVRYQAAKSAGLDVTGMTTFRDLVPTKLAVGIWDCLMKYKETIPNLIPETETCELLILDGSVDRSVGGEIRMKSGKLTPDELKALNKTRVLGEEKPAAGKDCSSTLLEELIESLSKGKLSGEDYPCLNDPRPTLKNQARSVRTRRAQTWSDSDYECSFDYENMGQRIFVVIAGRATRSELRICHKLTAKFKREVVLGFSSLLDPAPLNTKMKTRTTTHEIDLKLNARRLPFF